MLNESLVKYLAGLLDADGSMSFSFKEDQNREGLFFTGLRLMLASSKAVDRHGFVESLPELTRMGSISHYGASRQFVTWTVNRRSEVEMLTPRLIKHMIIKAHHWQWMLDMWRTMRSHSNTCTASDRILLVQAGKESRRNNRGPLKPKNHPSWAWLAGYLDGDGCYTHRQNPGTKNGKTYLQWTINVSAVAHINDQAVLQFLQMAFGGQIRDHGKSPNVKVWVRSLGNQNRSFALNFLSKLARHARLKRHKIDQMIHHHQQRLSVPSAEAQAIV